MNYLRNKLRAWLGVDTLNDRVTAVELSNAATHERIDRARKRVENIKDEALTISVKVVNFLINQELDQIINRLDNIESIKNTKNKATKKAVRK